jgi:Aspartyl protease
MPLARRTLLLATLAAPIAAAAPPTTPFPISIIDRRCIVPVLLDGRLANMLLDTGAERTVVTREAAIRLKLRLDTWVETTLRGAGGELETRADVDVTRATLGGVNLFQRHPGPLSLAVTDFNLGGPDGLLGSDILRHYTIDLDYPRAQLTLRPPSEKAPNTNAVKLRLLWPNQLLAPVRLEGHDLTALVDTGASTSLINARGLYRLGLTRQRMARDPAIADLGLGGTLKVHEHRFTELRFGPLTVRNPLMLTAAEPEPAYDLALGLDVLGQQRLLLSYAAQTLGFIPA